MVPCEFYFNSIHFRLLKKMDSVLYICSNGINLSEYFYEHLSVDTMRWVYMKRFLTMCSILLYSFRLKNRWIYKVAPSICFFFLSLFVFHRTIYIATCMIRIIISILLLVTRKWLVLLLYLHKIAYATREMRRELLCIWRMWV